MGECWRLLGFFGVCVLVVRLAVAAVTVPLSYAKVVCEVVLWPG